MNQPFRFMSFKDWVPDPLRFWLYIIYLICFQFSNGIYFAAISQMEGSLDASFDDVKMMGYAVLIGLTMYFPLAFRLKFRFTNRTCLLTAALVLIACNAIVPHIHSVPLLIAICFIAGFFRLFGTFECFSSILPKVAPTHNYAVFLSLVFFVVLGVIHVFDIAVTYIVYYYTWQHVHYLAIALLLTVVLLVFTTMRPFRPMPMMPLYGVDWIGLIVWSICILSAIFVVQYGEQLDWFHSPYIRIATGVTFIAAAVNCWRMTNIRHPFLEIAAFKMRNLVNLLILFLLLDILLASKDVLQNAFTGAILRLDALNAASLNWFEFIGMALGAVFSLYALVRLRLTHKLVAFIGMTAIVAYLTMMYFTVSPATNIEKLYMSLICCGFGHVSIFISLTVYAQATAPFKNYFQILCILGFIRTGIGGPLGDALYTRALSGLSASHAATIGSAVPTAIRLPFSDLQLAVANEALIAAIRELFGWSVIIGAGVLVIIAASRFKAHISRKIPTLGRVWKVFSLKFGV